MSQYVKISSIGARPIEMDVNIASKTAVNKMIAHWHKEIDQVLPDSPDLIVLPEVCDRPDKCSRKDAKCEP